MLAQPLHRSTTEPCAEAPCSYKYATQKRYTDETRDQVNNFTWEGGDAIIGPTYASIGRKAEEAGFDSFWVMDHFFQIPGLGQAEEPMLESYSALAFIAGQTQKIKLGTMVTGVTYRHPGLLVKTVTTLDVLSGGRAYLGIGAGWFEREHLGLGVRFPPLKERFERLEETLQIAHLMWSGEVTQYNGKHYQLAETINSPQALTRPHPPILIGGGGETEDFALHRQVWRRLQPICKNGRRGVEAQAGRAEGALRGGGAAIYRYREDQP